MVLLIGEFDQIGRRALGAGHIAHRSGLTAHALEVCQGIERSGAAQVFARFVLDTEDRAGMGSTTSRMVLPANSKGTSKRVP